MTTVRTVNDQGMREIREFLAANHKLGANFTPDMIAAWASDADFQLAEGNPAAIEIPARDSVTGRPVELYISPEGLNEYEIEMGE